MATAPNQKSRILSPDLWLPRVETRGCSSIREWHQPIHRLMAPNAARNRLAPWALHHPKFLSPRNAIAYSTRQMVY